MGQTTSQIETLIESKREDLGSNLQELEQKVKAVTDWRQYFRDKPMTMIGVAFGGGILLATMMGGRRESRSRGSYQGESLAKSDAPQASLSIEKRKMLDTWDTIKGALVGVAAAQVKGFLSDVVPNFEEHFQKTEKEKGVPSPS